MSAFRLRRRAAAHSAQEHHPAEGRATRLAPAARSPRLLSQNHRLDHLYIEHSPRRCPRHQFRYWNFMFLLFLLLLLLLWRFSYTHLTHLTFFAGRNSGTWERRQSKTVPVWNEYGDRLDSRHGQRVRIGSVGHLGRHGRLFAPDCQEIRPFRGISISNISKTKWFTFLLF